MIDISVPDLWVGVAAISATVFFAAWRESVADNLRDAKFLAAAGALSAVGGIATWLH